MYKSTYLAVRVQSDTDLDIRPPPCEVDIMLWLIDVYDLPSSDEAAEAVKDVILEHYLLLNSSVPGLMTDWTKGMMAWVTYLHALVPSFEYDQEWVIQQELMIKRDPHKWSVSDLRVILDALSMNDGSRCSLISFIAASFLPFLSALSFFSFVAWMSFCI